MEAQPPVGDAPGERVGKQTVGQRREGSSKRGLKGEKGLKQRWLKGRIKTKHQLETPLYLAVFIQACFF